ncbi:hypothetical protein D9M69_663610 [compost metagenome]
MDVQIAARQDHSCLCRRVRLCEDQARTSIGKRKAAVELRVRCDALHSERRAIVDHGHGVAAGDLTKGQCRTVVADDWFCAERVDVECRRAGIRMVREEPVNFTFA